MPARETLFAFILVVSALAGLASAAPSSAPPPYQGPPHKPHAVNQLACSEDKTGGTTLAS
ncbi:hypothetical protein PtA15_7A331 [Puccinia triticina]|uniref:Uncharacterized protein n=1 Tax=Puccinia triticina TaxID=208348 RepID=A0ABY7CNJ3_9BASI|nr:uncharacterized protein PtA15_7A331 [Puccinia triticina]WAQ86605.1 hypothetical protein PtA15_7A331 [Puccinia triticina]